MPRLSSPGGRLNAITTQFYDLDFEFRLAFELCHLSLPMTMRLSHPISQGSQRQMGNTDMQASSLEGHSTIFYCKTVLMGDSHEHSWLVC